MSIVLDRESLEESPLADLHLLANELGVDGFRRLRKPDLIDAILARQADAPADEAGAPRRSATTPTRRTRPPWWPSPARARARTEPEPAPAPRRAAVAAPPAELAGRARAEAVAEPAEAEAAVEDEELEDGATDEDAPVPPAPRPPRRPGGAAATATATGRDLADEPAAAERRRRAPSRASWSCWATGRASSASTRAPSPRTTTSMFRRAGQALRARVSVTASAGPVRAPRRSERYPSLIRVDTINGRPADEVAEGTRFDDLPACPAERFALEAERRHPQGGRVADAVRPRLARHRQRRPLAGKTRAGPARRRARSPAARGSR